jgi:hypothetical protein
LNFDAPLVFLERFWGVVTRADCCFVEDPDHTLMMHFDLALCFARDQFQLEIFSRVVKEKQQILSKKKLPV